MAEIEELKKVLRELRAEGKVSLAYLYGSYQKGQVHPRSDIDLAVYLNVTDDKDAMDVIDRILMAIERHVEILRLDDGDESPFIVQEALKGIPLVEPDMETLYRVSHGALHESESIRHHRALTK